jgi:RNA recognition motif-containing protein
MMKQEMPSAMPKLFLGNIPHSANENDISGWMKSHGFLAESVDIILDKAGMRRGFCFATLVDSAQLEPAVAALNGKVMSGRPITVNHAVPLQLDGNHQQRRRIA